MAVDRRTLWLGGVMITALIVAGILWSGGGSETSASAPRRAPRAPAAGKTAEPESAPAHVNLEGLQARRADPVDSGRNPFRFRPPPAPPAASLPQRPVNQGPAGPAPVPMPVGPPPPPTIPLKFIGLVTQGNTRLAVLTDGRGAPQSGKEGDIILGQYRILKIGTESIDLAYADGRGRQTIRLTGQ